ncbi:MAG: Rieske (2Fe-2S) protein [Planctomycetaceae bacterium]|nr:Rieske (2Fe-2S) protein [Planctomycetaceae bacterium]
MLKDACCCRQEETDTEDRRGFLKQVAAITSGAVAFLVPTAAGVATFLNPLRQKAKGSQWLRVAALDSLPTDGTPQRFPVITDRTDAWIQFPAEPVGAVFLRRVGAAVTALQSSCPHAGCTIGYDAQAKCFVCPCHKQPRFDLSGKRVDGAKSYSPRDMDGLNVEVRNRGEVWVEFQTFRGGTPTKIAQA